MLGSPELQILKIEFKVWGEVINFEFLISNCGMKEVNQYNRLFGFSFRNLQSKFRN